MKKNKNEISKIGFRCNGDVEVWDNKNHYMYLTRRKIHISKDVGRKLFKQNLNKINSLISKDKKIPKRNIYAKVDYLMLQGWLEDLSSFNKKLIKINKKVNKYMTVDMQDIIDNYKMLEKRIEKVVSANRIRRHRNELKKDIKAISDNNKRKDKKHEKNYKINKTK